MNINFETQPQSLLIVTGDCNDADIIEKVTYFDPEELDYYMNAAVVLKALFDFGYKDYDLRFDYYRAFAAFLHKYGFDIDEDDLFDEFYELNTTIPHTDNGGIHKLTDIEFYHNGSLGTIEYTEADIKAAINYLLED